MEDRPLRIKQLQDWRRMIPRREFILYMLGKTAPKHSKISYTKLHKVVYIINRDLIEQFHQDLGYKFESFRSHTGPSDPDLQKDLDLWTYLGLIKDIGSPYYVRENKPSVHFRTHNIRLNNIEKDCTDNTISGALSQLLGSEERLRMLEEKFRELLEKDEKALILEASSLWIKNHPDKSGKVESFLTHQEQ